MAKKEAPGKNGFKYREQYGIIILCKDEKAQEQLFNKLKSEGYKLKVVTV
jgi:predicted 3-demethylubiquinone-9 3-methyltransferase (glyoxalase superfamily)